MAGGKEEARRVLVLDGDQGASLAIVRSLGRFGLAVDAGERRRRFLASYSRYAHRALTYPDPLLDPAAFVRAIESMVREGGYALVIPVTEDTVRPLASARERIERFAPLAIAPNAALERMIDKAKTFALAVQVGVPVPRSITVSGAEELASAEGSVRYPVVVKPVRSIENGTKLNVGYAHDRRTLIQLAERSWKQGGAVVLQEYFRGTGMGVEVLVDRGEIVYAFQHKRLHELPLTGGGSCLRESVSVDPQLLAYAEKLMATAGWHGVAMVEFKVDEASGEARLMEVNGRFWGSLPLAVASGADFPRLLFELLVEGRRPDPARERARIGVVSRKLSDDVYWYVQVLRPDQDEPLIEWPTKGRIAKDTLLGLSPRHRFDVQSLEDPRPGLVDAARTGRWFAERFGSAARMRTVALSQSLARRTGIARRRLEEAQRILFVCYGNINRSMLAERHLRSLVDGSVEIASAGFHKEIGRRADPAMVRVAASHGLHIESSASRLIDALMVSRADLIFAMETKHLLRLFEEYPSTKKKAFLLSAVLKNGVPLEIADPYGGTEAAYARCFSEVTACTRAIADTLTRRPGRG